MRLLDLFCGAGGAAMGYSQAGFDDIIGVDINPQPNYPFRFIQSDVFEFMAGIKAQNWVGMFDMIHASPPCQHFTRYAAQVKRERYLNLIPQTRELLEQTGISYVIENVPGAPIRADSQLCGSMFGLDVRRHRWFEYGGWWAFSSGGCDHLTPPDQRSVKKGSPRNLLEIGSWGDPLEMQKAAMGVDWPITVRELSEAIPPAYTKFIGEQFLAQMSSGVVGT